MPINLNDIVISNINGSDYRYIINGISKSNALNLLKNADLTKKQNIIKTKKKLKTFSPYIKRVKKL